MSLRNWLGLRPPRQTRIGELCNDSPIDWRVGDLAQCIGSGGWKSFEDMRDTSGPAQGQVLRVESVRLFDGIQFLTFEPWRGDAYAAECFIRPEERSVETFSFDFRKLLDPEHVIEKEPEHVG